MKSKKNGFTLIEMIIVIVIIAIILWFTMKFSGDRIRLLNNKNVQEEFIWVYDNLFSTAMNTNYIAEWSYDNLVVQLDKNYDWVKYSYYNGGEVLYSDTNNVLWSMEIESIILNSGEKDNLLINFTPYTLWATFDNGQTGTANIKISVNNKKQIFCFQISSKLWRLENIECN